jgi:hypothetical protein
MLTTFVDVLEAVHASCSPGSVRVSTSRFHSAL